MPNKSPYDSSAHWPAISGGQGRESGELVVNAAVIGVCMILAAVVLFAAALLS
jgi:hypothetical protein